MAHKHTLLGTFFVKANLAPPPEPTLLTRARNHFVCLFVLCLSVCLSGCQSVSQSVRQLVNQGSYSDPEVLLYLHHWK